MQTENKLARIRAMIATKPYAKHIIEPYFTVDTQHPDAADVEQVHAYAQRSSRSSLFSFASWIN